MTTDELIRRAEERLNKTSNPALPPEQTLKAIISLGKERDKWAREYEEEYQGKKKAEKLLTEQASSLESIKKELEVAKKRGDDMAFLAGEYEECLRKIGMHECEGNEVITAFRVYNLNKGSSDKKTINCRCFSNLDDAKAAYRKHCEDMGFAFDEIEMLPWLFQEVL